MLNDRILVLNLLLNVLVVITLQFREEAPREHVHEASEDHECSNDRPPKRLQQNDATDEDVRDAAAGWRHEESREGLEDSMTQQVELSREDDDAKGRLVEVDEMPAEVRVEDHLVGGEEAGSERRRNGDGLGDVDGGAGAAAFAVEARVGWGDCATGIGTHGL